MESENEIGLAQLIVSLRKEMVEAQKKGESEDLRFTVDDIELEVEFVTSKSGEGGGGVKFWVYNAELKAKLGEQKTHRVRFKLKPRSGGGDTLLSGDVQK